MLNQVQSIQDLRNALPCSDPTLSAVDEARSQKILSHAFLNEAEKLGRWTSIGFNEWLSAGRWWLLKAQTQLYAGSPSGKISAQAYADLLKASFILVDMFPDHPQRPYWSREYVHVELLAEELKRELYKTKGAGLRRPDFSAIERSDLRIWSEIPLDLGLTPTAYIETGMDGPGGWSAQNETVLWRGFGLIAKKRDLSISARKECVILILQAQQRNDKAKHLYSSRIVCQDQRGVILLSKC